MKVSTHSKNAKSFTKAKRVAFKGNHLLVISNSGEVVQKFRLAKITPEKLNLVRQSSKSFCIAKSEGKYVITEIPSNLCLVNTLGPHLCNSCSHCYATSESYGGCSKVCDRHIDEHTDLPKPLAVEYSARLEKYDFIKKGFETIGCTSCNAFIVLNCEHYVQDSARKRKKAFRDSVYIKTRNREPIITLNLYMNFGNPHRTVNFKGYS